MSRDFKEHYEGADEASRLREGVGALEFARSREVIARFLPAACARVLDIGGGPGAYAGWLSEGGHEVLLVDPVVRHVEEARRRGIAAVVGDARALPWGSPPVDLVLLQGPLYHLIERADRLKALEEAWRVLREGGVVVAAAISRYASLIGPRPGLLEGSGVLFDPCGGPPLRPASEPHEPARLLHDGVLPPAGGAPGRASRGGLL